MAESKNTLDMTVEEYLALDSGSDVRYEYVKGQVFAMTGGTLGHAAICSNLFAAVEGFARGSGCRAFSAHARVRIEEADSFYYPDVVLTCEPFDATAVCVRAPSFIAEVLSPSTQQIDKREKLAAYKQIPSLKYYVIVHQNKMLLEVHARVGERRWQNTLLRYNNELILEGIGNRTFSFEVSQVYSGIDLPLRVEEPEAEYELA